MTTFLLTYSRALTMPLLAQVGLLQAKIDGLLSRADAAEPGASTKDNRYTIWIVVCGLIPLCILVILALIGPYIGNNLSPWRGMFDD